MSVRPRPRLLDLFCGAGGSAVGYARAGFEVIGVDEIAMPDYPYEFMQGDALKIGRRIGKEFAAIHASPPCHSSSAMTKGTNRKIAGRYPDLIEKTREVLWRSGLPTVMENVQGAALRRDLTLCGEMFGLKVLRHRYFELGRWHMVCPDHLPHRGRVNDFRHGEWIPGYYVPVYGTGGSRGLLKDWQQAMGIDWITHKQTMSQAIPPAYTELIGKALMREVIKGR